MPDPLPVPVRVLVRGASTVGYSGVMSGPRSDFGFPRVIERDLLRSGRAASVVSLTVGGMRTNTVLRRWEHDVLGWSPDVFVIMAGHYETLHVLWPQWLERHANSNVWAPRALSRLYRKRVLRPAWRAMVRLQTAVDTRVPSWWWRRRIVNAVADIAKTVTQARTVASPLVIVMEVPQPSAPGRSLFPGMPERVDFVNAQLASMVDGFGQKDVRLFSTNAAIEAHAHGELDAALPDGFHFTPALHGEIGHRLAEEIGTWADSQEHLA